MSASLAIALTGAILVLITLTVLLYILLWQLEVKRSGKVQQKISAIIIGRCIATIACIWAFWVKDSVDEKLLFLFYFGVGAVFLVLIFWGTLPQNHRSIYILSLICLLFGISACLIVIRHSIFALRQEDDYDYAGKANIIGWQVVTEAGNDDDGLTAEISSIQVDLGCCVTTIETDCNNWDVYPNNDDTSAAWWKYWKGQQSSNQWIDYTFSCAQGFKKDDVQEAIGFVLGDCKTCRVEWDTMERHQDFLHLEGGRMNGSMFCFTLYSGAFAIGLFSVVIASLLDPRKQKSSKEIELLSTKEAADDTIQSGKSGDLRSSWSRMSHDKSFEPPAIYSMSGCDSDELQCIGVNGQTEAF